MSSMQQQVQSKGEIVAELVAPFAHDPYGYAMTAYPWGEAGTPLHRHKGPRPWQKRIMLQIKEHLENPETRCDPLRIARASGHGIGKSALIGMLIDWGMTTMVDTRITVTSNTDTQLKSKTVPEVTKWSRMSIAAEMFYRATTALYSTDHEHTKSWRADFVPWSAENSEAFAGLHNEGRRLILIFDEASGIDDIIWEVAEGAMTDENTEIIWIVFGNPTRNIGRFRECFRKFRKLWNVDNIDSRDVEGTNNKLFAEWAETYGEDSDFFRVRVRGQFPAQAARQFFNTDDLDEAWGKHLKEDMYSFAPVIIGVDPAWEGDDSFVIGARQGLKFEILEEHAKNDNDLVMANRIAQLEDQLKADAVFIDGGYGTGIISAGRTMGRNWQIVWFNEKSLRPDCKNKRAEMHANAKDWLKMGASLGKDQELYDELIAVEVIPTLDGKIQLMPKKDMKEIIGRSPNKSDTLALTFAYPVAKKGMMNISSKNRKAQRRNPHDRLKRN